MVRSRPHPVARRWLRNRIELGVGPLPAPIRRPSRTRVGACPKRSDRGRRGRPVRPSAAPRARRTRAGTRLRFRPLQPRRPVRAASLGPRAPGRGCPWMAALCSTAAGPTTRLRGVAPTRPRASQARSTLGSTNYLRYGRPGWMALRFLRGFGGELSPARTINHFSTISARARRDVSRARRSAYWRYVGLRPTGIRASFQTTRRPI